MKTIELLDYIEKVCREMKADQQLVMLGKDCYANGILAMIKELKLRI